MDVLGLIITLLSLVILWATAAFDHHNTSLIDITLIALMVGIVLIFCGRY